MQTDRDRARRAAMGAFALASVFGAGTPALANENGNADAQGNSAPSNGTKCHHPAATETTTTDSSSTESGSGNVAANGNAHANGHVNAHVNAGVRDHGSSGVRAHGAGTAAVRVHGKVDVATHRRGAVHLQAKREKRSGRAHAKAMGGVRI